MKTLKEMIAVMQGYADGRSMRVSDRNGTLSTATVGEGAIKFFNWEDFDYSLIPREVVLYAAVDASGDVTGAYMKKESAEGWGRNGCVIVTCKGEIP